MRAAPDLQTDGLTDFVDAVGDAEAGRAWGVVVGRVGNALSEVHPARGQVEGVAVAGGLRDGGAGGVDVRTADGAFLDGGADFEGVRAEVAHGCEAGVEDGGEAGGQAGTGECGGRGEEGGELEGVVAEEVGVAVPEAGEEDGDGGGWEGLEGRRDLGCGEDGRDFAELDDGCVVVERL